MKPVDQLGHSPKDIEAGFKDAFHAPVVLACLQPEAGNAHPGMLIRFTKDDLSEFVHVNELEDAHGVLDPFMDKDKAFGPMWVLIKPGLTTVVHHEFKIKMPEEGFFKDYKEGVDYDDSCRTCW